MISSSLQWIHFQRPRQNTLLDVLFEHAKCPTSTAYVMEMTAAKARTNLLS